VRLVLPDAIWEQLLDEFQRQRPGVERIAFLDGYRSGDLGVITTLVVPDARCEPGFYTVGAEQMQQAGAHFRSLGMVRLAQVHTHGGDGLAHSERDDRMAYSQRAGAVSIVLPHHAAGRPTPSDGLVHVRGDGEWRAISRAEVSQLLVVVPSLLDFRRTECLVSPHDTRAPSAAGWRRWMEGILSLWPWRSRAK
jgi:proteasome lid subunit RPN8/RPN11